MPKRPRKSSNPIGGLFTHTERQEHVTRQKSSLERLNLAIDFEAFRLCLEDNLDYKSLDASQAQAKLGGRPPFDCVLMFKILLLQKLYSLSDDQMEFCIYDRTSFQRFLGLQHEGRIPDAKTIWKFRERLGPEGMEAVFLAFDGLLREKNLLTTQGTIVDASFVEVPQQHLTKKEAENAKEGKANPEWSEPERRQRDIDARHAQKNSEHHFGYKNHIKVHAKSKLIEAYQVTPAHTHDSQVIDKLVTEENAGDTVYADSAYAGAKIAATLRVCGVAPRIHERAYRNNPLTNKQKQRNTKLSRTRARVEHVFGDQINRFRGNIIRSIGKARAALQIGLGNLLYNLLRLTFLEAKVS